jgi:HK97 family phage major capsid protein
MGAQRLYTGEGPGGRYLDMPSERTKAISGAWLKHMIGRAFRNGGRPVPLKYRMSELDQRLVEYAVHECKFVGPYQYDETSEEAKHWFSGQKLDNDLYRKALLDDSTSGGLEAVPVEFDDVAILTPLLNGELFPFVNVRNVTRRRIEGFSIGNPTLQWGSGEGTQISLFNTAAFIAGFDNNIYPVTGAIEIGLDFEADSPVGVGDMIQSRYGESFRKELDNVVAIGNGTSQPQGVFNAASTTTVSASNATSGQ